MHIITARRNNRTVYFRRADNAWMSKRESATEFTRKTAAKKRADYLRMLGGRLNDIDKVTVRKV